MIHPDILKEFRALLRGRKIVEVRELNEAEKKAMYWAGEVGIIIFLDNGVKVIPQSDEEGNRPGWLGFQVPLKQNPGKRGRAACECGDPGCPVHKDKERCRRPAVMTAFRVDMEDETGTPMCQECAEDASESGVFRFEEEQP